MDGVSNPGVVGQRKCQSCLTSREGISSSFSKVARLLTDEIEFISTSTQSRLSNWYQTRSLSRTEPKIMPNYLPA